MHEQRLLTVGVECYAGHRGEQTPRTLILGDRRIAVAEVVDAWLTAKFSRLLELRAQDPGPFNYSVAVFSEWRGKAFYLNVRYRARSRRAVVTLLWSCPIVREVPIHIDSTLNQSSIRRERRRAAISRRRERW